MGGAIDGYMGWVGKWGCCGLVSEWVRIPGWCGWMSKGGWWMGELVGVDGQVTGHGWVKGVNARVRGDMS